MIKHGPDFYDDSKVFETYQKHREAPDTANETIEQPILWEMIGKPRGLDVVDLGCGDARVTSKFEELGAKSYMGIEGSKRMFELASKSKIAGFSRVLLMNLEELELSKESFDLAVSSLAFHYVADLPKLLTRVHEALKPGGRLIFSVEHPVITSCNQSMAHTDVKASWVVDDYFNRGPRTVDWMGGTVTKYHRTVEDYFNAVRNTGFDLETLRESDPPKQHFEDEALWIRRRRIPLFLILAGRKV
jgi:SAM-dependent methyltransferase